MDHREGPLQVIALRLQGEFRERDSSEIVATYREIAKHFGLKGPDQGRTKAKRAGWPAEPQNHPADPLRIRVPREAWEGAARARERGLSLRSERRAAREAPSPARVGEAYAAYEPRALTSEITALISQLTAAHSILREGIARAEAAAAEARALADQRAGKLAEAREQLGRTEGEVLALRSQAAADRDRAEALQAELTAWRTGGPVARAVRAFLHRR
jgi:hypothetical protein